MPDGEQVEITHRDEWRAWLEAHAATSRSVWVVTYRKHHEHHVLYDDLVEEALCCGWIDSVGRALDANQWRQ